MWNYFKGIKYYIPVMILVKANSTLLASSAEVSIKAMEFFSAKSEASSTLTYLIYFLSLLLPTNIIII